MKKSHLACLIFVSLILGLSCVAFAKNPAILSTEDAPAAVGPYSQGVKLGNLVFTSGQLPIVPTTGSITGGIAEQTRQVMENLKAILAQAKLTFDDVVMVTVYLQDLKGFTAFNQEYAKAFGCFVSQSDGAIDCTGVYVHPRATIQAAGIPRGAFLEISMIAGK